MTRKPHACRAWRGRTVRSELMLTLAVSLVAHVCTVLWIRSMPGPLREAAQGERYQERIVLLAERDEDMQFSQGGIEGFDDDATPRILRAPERSRQPEEELSEAEAGFARVVEPSLAEPAPRERQTIPDSDTPALDDEQVSEPEEARGVVEHQPASIDEADENWSPSEVGSNEEQVELLNGGEGGTGEFPEPGVGTRTGEIGDGDSPAAGDQGAPTSMGGDGQGTVGFRRGVEMRRSSNTSIPYPPEAWANRWQATCDMALDVDERGRVSRVLEVRCSSRTHIFEPAIRAHVLRHYRFQPAEENGVAVASVVRWRHRFVIQ